MVGLTPGVVREPAIGHRRCHNQALSATSRTSGKNTLPTMPQLNQPSSSDGATIDQAPTDSQTATARTTNARPRDRFTRESLADHRAGNDNRHTGLLTAGTVVG